MASSAQTKRRPASSTKLSAPANPDDPDAWFKLGKRRVDAGDKAGALEAYLKSFELRPAFDSAGNGGQHANALGKHDIACRLLAYSISNLPASMPEKKRKRAKKRLEEMLEDSLEHVGRVKLETREAAEITVDGKPAGRWPLDPPYLCLWPGERTVQAKLVGFLPASKTLKVEIGPPVTVELPLKASPENNKSDNGGSDKTKDGASDGPNLGLVIGGAALSVAAIGAGVGLMVMASGAGSDREELVAQLGNTSACAPGGNVPASCDEITSLSDDEQLFGGLGLGLLVTGGVAAAGTLTYALWPRGSSEETTSALRLLPIASQNKAGLLLVGSF